MLIGTVLSGVGIPTCAALPRMARHSIMVSITLDTPVQSTAYLTPSGTTSLTLFSTSSDRVLAPNYFPLGEFAPL